MVNLASRTPLVKNLLFIEGFSRGGKLLLGNILNGFAGVEPIQYYGLLEHLPFLEKFKLIERKTAEELIRCEIDTHCYEMLIGRNFNHRKYDGSSIYKVPGYKNYLKRSNEKDTNKNLKRFYKNGAYSFFMMHELIPHIKIYFDIFPHLKVISIKRNPVDIIYSWYQRGLLRRLGQDPKIFIIPLQSKNGPVPWYAYRFKDIYQGLPEIDRIILSINELFGMYKDSINKLGPETKKKILFIPFEELTIRHTNRMLQMIGQFLDRRPLPAMKSILQREDVPRNLNHNQTCLTKEEKLMCTECKFKKISKSASPKYLKMIIKLKNEYEAGTTY